jgi:DNA polymerase III alpha subunit
VFNEEISAAWNHAPMIELHDRIIDQYGNVSVKENFLVEQLYRGVTDFNNVFAADTPEIRRYNDACTAVDDADKCLTIYQAPDIPLAEYDSALQREWFIPSEYEDLDVASYLLDRCKTEEEQLRIAEEFSLYEEKGLLPVLRLLIYLVDTMRANKVVWGVGRGSSVASFALYLIGIIKVNPMKFGLDIHEFLK